MAQDDFQRAKERYDDAREAIRENHVRMREDLHFSNPAAPQQWNAKTITDREGRPTLTLDQTNQFIQQVVNDGRQNTPSLQTMAVDGRADVLVAQQVNGMLRHLEYASRAAIAYDTSLEYSARVGIGWLRAVPVVVDGVKNYQEPRVIAVNDPLSCCIDGDSVEYDGQDAMFGFAETVMTERGFKRKWPKAKAMSFGSSDGWCDHKGIRVAEYFDVVEEKTNKLEIETEGGDTYLVTEQEYWDTDKKTGVRLPVRRTVEAINRRVRWCKMSGVEFLEETDFPSEWIGLVPVYGHVIWIDGKRYVCGLTRRLMDGQRLHNYGMSSLAEQMLEQPKSPFMAPARAIEGYEDHWRQLNKGNPSYLPYNDLDVDEEGETARIAAPIRLAAPAFPVAAERMAQLGTGEMQAASGMFKSTLGQQSNAVSGRAKVADKQAGDNATFHYIDNQRRSLEHLGRILLQMQARLIDTPRRVRILGLDSDKVSFLQVDPEMDDAVKKNGAGKVVAVNLNVGKYDVRVKVGPSYTTMREELQTRLTELGQGNPQLAAALAPLLVKMADLPDAERVVRVCMALLPPAVQAAYNEDEGDDVPAHVKAQLQGMGDRLKQATELVQKLSQELEAANSEAQAKHKQAEDDLEIKRSEVAVKATEAGTRQYQAETERLRMRAEQAAAAADTTAQVGDLLSVVEQMAEAHRATAADVEQLSGLLFPADADDSLPPAPGAESLQPQPAI